ncbi:PadR family transcriptional regulator [Humibacter ginsenosidimutans]|uniref:Helix-turn-helix transcriptional regulator n=1 Tax=Humibacter ginsenosidimutans TaxID=2599293 RepID=A0A5B8M2I5_9MICO|nr:PadR family transcriptional regulator [Humibacter ginsenosidimutans]QDZ14446.1 helix-turn-helix transcriptional regulator [Humibacter ginsenosidimutans]
MTTHELREPALSILTVLAGGRRHGYAIIKEADEVTSGRVKLKVSSLYAALDRLEGDGLVVRAGDEAVDGRLRRYFALTDAGEDALRAEADRMEAKARVARERLALRHATATAAARPARRAAGTGILPGAYA